MSTKAKSIILPKLYYPARTVNFQNPFIVRRWLRLLQLDKDTAYRIIPSIITPAGYLGFSFKSNPFGLRGPSNQNAPNVILGTSYGMGFGVDNGKNWYEIGLNSNRWFNASLPSGPIEWKEILSKHYQGAFSHVLVLYHPNLIQHAHMYLSWRKTNSSLFEHFRWKTTFKDCLALSIQRLLTKPAKLRKGQILHIQENKQRYTIKARYAFINHLHDAILAEIFFHYNDLLSMFDYKTIIRVHVKEEEVPPSLQTNALKDTLRQYDYLWKWTKRELGGLSNILFIDSPKWGLPAFNPLDTHWSITGNQLFADFLKSNLADLQ